MALELHVEPTCYRGEAGASSTRCIRLAPFPGRLLGRVGEGFTPRRERVTSHPKWQLWSPVVSPTAVSPTDPQASRLPSPSPRSNGTQTESRDVVHQLPLPSGRPGLPELGPPHLLPSVLCPSGPLHTSPFSGLRHVHPSRKPGRPSRLDRPLLPSTSRVRTMHLPGLCFCDVSLQYVTAISPSCELRPYLSPSPNRFLTQRVAFNANQGEVVVRCAVDPAARGSQRAS